MDSEFGWVKLHREILESPIFNDSDLLKTYIWCLLRATHSKRDVFLGNQLIHLNKGEFVTGFNKASIELGTTESKTRRTIAKLEKLGVIKRRATNLFSIITVADYSYYTEQKRGSSQYGAGYYKGQEDKEKEMLEILSQTEEQKNIPTQTLESE